MFKKKTKVKIKLPTYETLEGINKILEKVEEIKKLHPKIELEVELLRK